MQYSFTGRATMVRRRRKARGVQLLALGVMLVSVAADSEQRSPTRPDGREVARAEAVEASLELNWVTRRAIQRRLQQDDFDPGPLDGLMGSRTRDAIRSWQHVQGMLPTGYLDARQAEQLREPSFPLHDAAWAGDLARMRRLLAAGTDVNGGDRDRKTPLHLAAVDGHVEAIDALIEAGADVDASGGDGYGEGTTPLHVAVAHDHAGAITALIAAGADVNSRDFVGRSPTCRPGGPWKPHAVRRPDCRQLSTFFGLRRSLTTFCRGECPPEGKCRRAHSASTCGCQT